VSGGDGGGDDDDKRRRLRLLASQSAVIGPNARPACKKENGFVIGSTYSRTKLETDDTNDRQSP
jgi:hypothetical protein